MVACACWASTNEWRALALCARRGVVSEKPDETISAVWFHDMAQKSICPPAKRYRSVVMAAEEIDFCSK